MNENQLTTLDVFRNPNFQADLIEVYDALMIGGLPEDVSNYH
ncbi:MAG: hypothetical protein OEM26_09870 [Saprospiraceae bacterium]|nr:hypothetical protein [Saprospiraceae bacterium]